MAKVSYLEVVEMLSNKLVGQPKQQLEHIIARKKALKEEDDDLNTILDELLRDMQQGRE
jgi:hypothetical protein